MSDVIDFSALVMDDDDDLIASIQKVSTDTLPAADVTIAVAYAALSFRDALNLSGRGRMPSGLKQVPGIELTGTVVDSNDDRFALGDDVFTYGYGLGERYWGGMAGYSRAKADWLLPVPQGFSDHAIMALGAPAAAAQMAINELFHHGLSLTDGPVLVTASGSEVGRLAVLMLAHAGYQVAAAINDERHAELARQFGASEIIMHEELIENANRLLDEPRWAGIIDCAGGTILAAALGQLMPGCMATLCAPVHGHDLPVSLAPFVVRGCRLVGINPLNQPMEERMALWQSLGKVFSDQTIREKAMKNTEVIMLSEVVGYSARILQGDNTSRVLVNMTNL